jgi:hypothetical protein
MSIIHQSAGRFLAKIGLPWYTQITLQNKLKWSKKKRETERDKEKKRGEYQNGKQKRGRGGFIFSATVQRKFSNDLK